MKQVHVDARLEQLIPPLSENQIELLEKALIETGGPTQPLWLWGDVLVDGHHRYKICRTHALPYKTLSVWEDLHDLEQVKARMKLLAIGQRNLTLQQQSKLRAEVTVDLASDVGTMVAVRQTAEEAGVSERQVYRDIKKATAANELHEELRDSEPIWKMSPESMAKLALLDHDDQLAVADRAGHDAQKMSSELKRLETVKGSTLYDAKKAARKKKEEQKGARMRKKGLVIESVEQLASTAKTMREAHKLLQLSQGNWDRAYHHLTELDQILAEWKQQA